MKRRTKSSIMLFILTTVLLIFVAGCKKDKNVNEPLHPPEITTDNIANITESSALCKATIISNGGKRIAGNNRVTVSGICWSTNENPTITDNISTNGPMEGNFSSEIKDLQSFTKYFVRAYATNAAGTTYGNQISFTTTGPLAALNTTEITGITGSTAIGGGVLTAHGNTVTSRGVCWNAKDIPTINDSKTEDGSGEGSFISNITGLKPGVMYKVRAYAVNFGGIAYGETVLFMTTPPTVKDYDGNVYHAITIGTQVWMQENLKVTHFINGDPIPLPNLISGYVGNYGQLYLGSFVADPRGIAPIGWHIPTLAEWKTLETYVGGDADKLKEKGTVHWTSPNNGATNETGFTALPGGIYQGGQPLIGASGFWWTSTPDSPGTFWRRTINVNQKGIDLYPNDYSLGFSIRLVKD